MNILQANAGTALDRLAGERFEEKELLRDMRDTLKELLDTLRMREDE